MSKTIEGLKNFKITNLEEAEDFRARTIRTVEELQKCHDAALAKPWELACEMIELRDRLNCTLDILEEAIKMDSRTGEDARALSNFIESEFTEYLNKFSK